MAHIHEILAKRPIIISPTTGLSRNNASTYLNQTMLKPLSVRSRMGWFQSRHCHLSCHCGAEKRKLSQETNPCGFTATLDPNNPNTYQNQALSNPLGIRFQRVFFHTSRWNLLCHYGAQSRKVSQGSSPNGFTTPLDPNNTHTYLNLDMSTPLGLRSESGWFRSRH